MIRINNPAKKIEQIEFGVLASVEFVGNYPYICNGILYVHGP